MKLWQSLFAGLILANHWSCRLSEVFQKLSTSEILITTNKSKSICWNNDHIEKALKRIRFVHQLDQHRWIDQRTNDIYNGEALLQKVMLEFPQIVDELPSNEFPKISAVYFIRAQRLLRPVSDTKMEQRQRSFEFSLDNEVSAFSNTIEEYAKELRDIIQETLAKSSQTNQALDSSFPRRLFDQQQDIPEEEFTKRFDRVKGIQKALSEFGLSDIKEDSHPTYKLENAKALDVYINDAEQKLSVFSELLGKLKAFTGILNEHRFTFKRIDISKEDGFKFSTDQKKPLALSDLSSGEQQEVVLLYELLFKVKPETLVLIDEPELSLHVVWQKQFLDDLFKIIRLQKISIVIATHSPQIINNHWDLTVDLEKLRNAATSK